MNNILIINFIHFLYLLYLKSHNNNMTLFNNNFNPFIDEQYCSHHIIT